MLVGLVLATASPADAVIRDWRFQPFGYGTWNTAGNWNPSGTPTPNDECFISFANLVMLNAHGSARSLTMTAGTLHPQNFQLTVSQQVGLSSGAGLLLGPAHAAPSSRIYIGRDLTLTTGSYVNLQGGEMLTVGGTTTEQNAAALVVGALVSNPTLRVFSGSQVSAGDIRIGTRTGGAVCTLELQGQGSIVSQTDSGGLIIGPLGAASSSGVVNVGTQHGGASLRVGAQGLRVRQHGRLTVGSWNQVANLKVDGDININGGLIEVECFAIGVIPFEWAAGHSMTLTGGGVFRMRRAPHRTPPNSVYEIHSGPSRFDMSESWSSRPLIIADGARVSLFGGILDIDPGELVVEQGRIFAQDDASITGGALVLGVGGAHSELNLNLRSSAVFTETIRVDPVGSAHIRVLWGSRLQTQSLDLRSELWGNRLSIEGTDAETVVSQIKLGSNSPQPHIQSTVSIGAPNAPPKLVAEEVSLGHGGRILVGSGDHGGELIVQKALIADGGLLRLDRHGILSGSFTEGLALEGDARMEVHQSTHRPPSAAPFHLRGQATFICHETLLVASVPGSTLRIQDHAKAESVVTQVGNGSTEEGLIVLSGPGSVLSTDTLKVHPSGTIRLAGGRLAAGEISFLDGGTLEWTGGMLQVDVFHGNLVNASGVLAPGRTLLGVETGLAGGTTIVGNYTQQAGAILAIKIGGTSAGGTHDLVGITGTALLGGRLELSMIDGFVPEAHHTFTILNAAGGLFGTFANITTGQRLETADGRGSFFVHYGPGSPFNPNHIVLTAFETLLAPFDQWRALHFDPGELADEAISGAAAAPAHDNIGNVLKYLLGLDPKSPSQALLPRAVRTEDGLRFTYEVMKAATDAEVLVEVSEHLEIWEENSRISIEDTEDLGDRIRITVAVELGAAAPERLFLRRRARLK
ncbi:MAG: hypothetical protein EA425_07910 [Puniceicoccaceae bacterium]|nr:MAG: hypothetical protein EA425_07910 [Puniceicoccaceae bacterium]